MKLILPMCLLVLILATATIASAIESRSIRVLYDASAPTLEFATSELANALRAAGYKTQVSTIGKSQKSDSEWTIIAGLPAKMKTVDPALAKLKLEEEGFAIRLKAREPVIYVVGADPRGVMYGVLDIAEHIETGGKLTEVKAKAEKPAMPIRSLKINMPNWDSLYMEPEWADDWEWFLAEDYWRGYFRMMARNRYNISTIWHCHPYHWMVRIPGYPEATALSDEELERCKKAFSFIFAEAARHGMDTYLITWNIHYPPSFAEKHGFEHGGQDHPIIRDYMREAVKAVLREYPGLTGVGTCPGEWMPGPPDKDEEWLMDTYVPAILEVRGPEKFIHRYWGSEPKPMQQVFAANYPGKTYLDLKYNGESMYSHPKPHFVDPEWLNQTPRDYEILWHLRNDDLYVMRWGDAQFVRDTMPHCVGDGIAGFVTGSEYERPGPDRLYTDHGKRFQSWKQDFEKHWYRFMLWGKMGYNPELPDSYFQKIFESRYGKGAGAKLFETQTVASRIMPLAECFHWNYMNFDWAGEACMSPNPVINTARDGKGRNPNYRELGEYRSCFHNIREWIFNWTINDEEFIGIPEYVGNLLAGVEKGSDEAERQSPMEIADKFDMFASQVEEGLKGINPRPGDPGYQELVSWIWDLKLLALMGHYYAEKTRGGADLLYYWCTGDTAAQQRAIAAMKRAKNYWLQVVDIGDRVYTFPNVSIYADFRWSRYLPNVDQDIAFAEGPAPFQSRTVKWTALEPVDSSPAGIAACEQAVTAGSVGNPNLFKSVEVKTTEIDLAGSGQFAFWLEMTNSKSRYLNLRRVWPERETGTAFLEYELPPSEKRWCVIRNDLGRIGKIWYGTKVIYDIDEQGPAALKDGLVILVEPGVNKLVLRCDGIAGQDWGCSLRPSFRDSFTLASETRGDDTVIVTVKNTFPKSEIKGMKLTSAAWNPGWEVTPSEVTIDVGQQEDVVFTLRKVDPAATWSGVSVTGDLGGERKNTGAFTQLTGLKTIPAPATGDGYWRTELVDGKWAMVSLPEEGSSFIYYNVDNDYMFNVDKSVTLSIEYYDSGVPTEINIDYDSHLDGPGDGAFHRVVALTSGKKGWQTLTVNLSRVRFSNRGNGCDFRLSGQDGKPIRVRVVSVTE